VLTLAILLPAFVSLMYFLLAKKSASVGARLVASAHGISITLIYLLGVLVIACRMRLDSVQYPMLVALLIPALLMLISLKTYNGPKLLHLLLFVNIASAFFLAYLIAMVPAFP
jgi:hypothetical protein